MGTDMGSAPGFCSGSILGHVCGNPKSGQKVASKFNRGPSVAERKSGTESLIQDQFALPVDFLS